MTDDNKPNWRIVTPGILVMILAILLFTLVPTLGGRQVFGLLVLFIIGLGLTVAGSSDPSKEA